ncbi:hypothetical protein G1C96_1042 [Bifidobacterium sp. DSM 109958]|uniref:Uncharacterized protein n=1 Tax=Bifidobacterium moraviense TaxID=2675323 RepID=A0A7Y0F1U3_9BIFI|nr:hypothetical protein [Bifidobacterium sp. DSM 109958]
MKAIAPRRPHTKRSVSITASRHRTRRFRTVAHASPHAASAPLSRRRHTLHTRRRVPSPTPLRTRRMRVAACRLAHATSTPPPCRFHAVAHALHALYALVCCTRVAVRRRRTPSPTPSPTSRAPRHVERPHRHAERPLPVTHHPKTPESQRSHLPRHAERTLPVTHAALPVTRNTLPAAQHVPARHAPARHHRHADRAVRHADRASCGPHTLKTPEFRQSQHRVRNARATHVTQPSPSPSRGPCDAAMPIAIGQGAR